ncbi:MAG: hypothetical protein ABW217_08145 [Polyangiaceae bacterium]
MTLGSGSLQAGVFVATMLLGMFLADRVERVRERSAHRTEPTRANTTSTARASS